MNEAQPPVPGEPSYFFDRGLRFACQRCGHCCTGRAGRVQMTSDELAKICQHLGLAEGAFLERCCHLVDGQLSLQERPNGDCIFYDRGCTIYPVRPAQCRTYPFWTRNLRTPEAWAATARECRGIGQGPVHDRESILRQIQESPV